MNPNYRPWEIDLRDFPGRGSEVDKLTFLLRFAVLSPSGHNTQPWNFSIVRNTISLFVNRERSLERSDPQRRQLLLAFGCMIENLFIAADHYGFAPSVDYFPDPQNRDLVAIISFDKEGAGSRGADGDLITAIPLRHTNRGKYLDRSLPAHFVERVKKYGDDELKLSIVTATEEKNTIADIVNDATIEIMDNNEFREELSHYIRSSFTREHTGMPGFALEIPAPISLLASRLIKKINLSRGNKKKDQELLKRHTPGGFMVISSRNDEAADRLAAGRLFEKIWLAATKEGLNCSPLASAIQSPRHNQLLRQALHTDFEPQVFFRIGYGQKTFRHSPRFAVEQLLIPS